VGVLLVYACICNLLLIRLKTLRGVWKDPQRIALIGNGDAWLPVTKECDPFFARLRRSMTVLRNVFNVNCRTHVNVRLRRMIEDEARALP
jgi:hypothetical protein